MKCRGELDSLVISLTILSLPAMISIKTSEGHIGMTSICQVKFRSKQVGLQVTGTTCLCSYQGYAVPLSFAVLDSTRWNLKDVSWSCWNHVKGCCIHLNHECRSVAALKPARKFSLCCNAHTRLCNVSTSIRLLPDTVVWHAHWPVMATSVMRFTVSYWLVD